MVGVLRDLGLTLAEIQELANAYLDDTGNFDGPRLAAVLAAARTRTETRIVELTERLGRIAAFEETFADELAGRADFRSHDPTFRT